MIDQQDNGSAQNVNSPESLIRAHQTKDRNETPNKNNNLAIFDNLDLQKSFVEIDGQRYPRDSSTMIHEDTDYIEQYKDIKLFFREHIGEPILNPLLSYPDMKTKYPTGITDLGQQLDHITPKKFQLFQEYGTDPDNARLFVISVRRRENELISDGNKLIEVKVM